MSQEFPEEALLHGVMCCRGERLFITPLHSLAPYLCLLHASCLYRSLGHLSGLIIYSSHAHSPSTFPTLLCPLCVSDLNCSCSLKDFLCTSFTCLPSLAFVHCGRGSCKHSCICLHIYIRNCRSGLWLENLASHYKCKGLLLVGMFSISKVVKWKIFSKQCEVPLITTMFMLSFIGGFWMCAESGTEVESSQTNVAFDFILCYEWLKLSQWTAAAECLSGIANVFLC